MAMVLVMMMIAFGGDDGGDDDDGDGDDDDVSNDDDGDDDYVSNDDGGDDVPFLRLRYKLQEPARPSDLLESIRPPTSQLSQQGNLQIILLNYKMFVNQYHPDLLIRNLWNCTQ